MGSVLFVGVDKEGSCEQVCRDHTGAPLYESPSITMEEPGGCGGTTSLPLFKGRALVPG